MGPEKCLAEGAGAVGWREDRGIERLEEDDYDKQADAYDHDKRPVELEPPEHSLHHKALGVWW